MKRIITNLLGAMGYQLLKTHAVNTTARTMEGALQLLSKKHPINSIIAVGASDGIWSRLALNFYPNRNISWLRLIQLTSSRSRSLSSRTVMRSLSWLLPVISMGKRLTSLSTRKTFMEDRLPIYPMPKVSLLLEL